MTVTTTLHHGIQIMMTVTTTLKHHGIQIMMTVRTTLQKHGIQTRPSKRFAPRTRFPPVKLLMVAAEHMTTTHRAMPGMFSFTFPLSHCYRPGYHQKTKTKTRYPVDTLSTAWGH